ncbi:MAG: hypothetical protein KVP17_001095 [Porospora cf. gigantea B]|uniref:uncharacterized protein n=2 Tax=Porospora cf. gigantea B TaxID=2853592 RepID=UPI003571B912|nr:MAG: hypothetical protein KVP17_001095 [Porospora cf. gigantea B]
MDFDNLNKKAKFVQQGVFQAELNEFLCKVLAEDGYSGVEVRKTHLKMEIIIRATRTREVLGERGVRIRELASLIKKRFNIEKLPVELLVERVEPRGLCAMAQAESLRFKLLKGMAVRRACYGVVRNIMDAGAIGCVVTVSGKLRAQRAKTMKFGDGFLLTTGNPSTLYVEQAIRTVLLRQGILGVRVRIMRPHDPEGKAGPATPIPDHIKIQEPKIEETPVITAPATAEEPPLTPVTEAAAPALEASA